MDQAASEERPAASLAPGRAGVTDVEGGRDGNEADKKQEREHLEELVCNHGEYCDDAVGI